MDDDLSPYHVEEAHDQEKKRFFYSNFILILVFLESSYRKLSIHR